MLLLLHEQACPAEAQGRRHYRAMEHEQVVLQQLQLKAKSMKKCLVNAAVELQQARAQSVVLAMLSCRLQVRRPETMPTWKQLFS